MINPTKKGNVPMKKLILTLTTFVALATVAQSAMATCTYPDDIASDGSRCGGRASTVRPGGYR